ncbi:MAG TPA: GNAT family protein [Chloroflexota bacterium]|nr:GNAT family protein [Chloroflexota bacterium]
MLQGKLVSLRGVEKEDLEQIREWLTDPELLHLLGARPMPLGNVEADKLPELFRLREGRVLAITSKDKGLVGLIAVGNFHEFNRTAQVLVLVGDRGEWNRGYGTDALRSVTRFVFEDLNLNCLEAHIPEFNTRAVRAFAKVGFQQEGKLRSRLFLRGRYWDVVVASALRETWNGERAADPTAAVSQAVPPPHSTPEPTPQPPATPQPVQIGQSDQPIAPPISPTV